MREQGYPPLEVCQLARGEEWRGCSPVISVEVGVGQGQGERDERDGGWRRWGSAAGGGPHLVKARFRRVVERTHG